MAMTKCPECGNEISDKADSCPKCGYSLKKAKQKKNAKGCIILFIILFILMIGFCSHVADEVEKKNAAQKTESVQEAPKPKELTEKDKYEKRVDRCIAWKGLRSALAEQFSHELKSPRSYEAISIKCDYPKDGEALKDTLTCIHAFYAKNSYGAEIEGSALLKIILPPYNPVDMYKEKCSMKIISMTP